MATHFPALEDFEDSVTATEPITDATLLSLREQETLGESFGTDFPELIGAEDQDESARFQSSFPPVDLNEGMSIGGIISDSSQPYMPGNSSLYGAPPASFTEEEEPECIKEWRDRTSLRIQHQDEQSDRKKQETVKKAQQAIDDFYEGYNIKKEKLIEQSRTEAEEFLAARENPSYGGTTWERIAKLVDLSDKASRTGKSDKSRFRDLLLSLKNDENAPGARITAS